MEMGAKSLYSRQPSLQLRLDDGELTVVAVDENSEIEVVSAARPLMRQSSAMAALRPLIIRLLDVRRRR